jgi:hypothetical protein
MAPRARVTACPHADKRQRAHHRDRVENRGEAGGAGRPGADVRHHRVDENGDAGRGAAAGGGRPDPCDRGAGGQRRGRPGDPRVSGGRGDRLPHLVASLAPWRLTLLVAGACSACSGSKLQSAGGPCLLVTDCQLGLACVKNRCSSDFSGIVNTEDAAAAGPTMSTPVPDDAGPDMSVVPPAGDAGDDATVADAASQD